jgi:phage tail protein X
MRFHRKLATSLALGLLALSATVQPATAAVPAAGTFMSQAGDFLGQGASLSVPDFSARKYASNGVQFWSATLGWSVTIAPATGQPLAVGAYANAVRFADATHPGLDVSGSGRGCNQITGVFWIDDIALDANGDPSRIAVRIEGHCEGKAPAFYGSITSAGAALNAVTPPAALAAPAPVTPTPPPAPVAVPPSAAPAADHLPLDPTPADGRPAGSCGSMKKVAKGYKFIVGNCKKSHSQEVIGSWKNAFSAIPEAANAQVICQQQFAQYVGIQTYASSYHLQFLFPSVGTWALGDRSVTCLVGNYDNSKLPAGSIRGTKR